MRCDIKLFNERNLLVRIRPLFKEEVLTGHNDVETYVIGNDVNTAPKVFPKGTPLTTAELF